MSEVSIHSQSRRRSSPFLRWLQSHYGVSWIVALIFLINTFVTGFAFPSTETSNSPDIPPHLYDLLFGVFGALGLLFIARFIKASPEGQLRTRQIIGAWSFAAVIAVISTLVIERIAIGHGLKPGRWAAIPYSVESAMGQLAVFTILVAGIAEMRSASMELAVNRHKLREMQSNLTKDLAAKKAELEAQVAHQIEPVLDNLRTTIQSMSTSEVSNNQSAIPQIKGAIDQVVRPLSHTLGRTQSDYVVDVDIPGQSISEIRKEISRISFRQRWLMRVPLGSAFEPVVGTLAMALFILPSMSYIFDVATALTIGIPALCAVGVTSQLLHKALLRFEFPYLASNIFGVIANVSLMFVFLAVVDLSPESLDQAFVSGLGIGVSIMMSISGYFGLVVERRFRFLDQAREANDEIASVLTRMRHELAISQRQLGRLLHGGVQARLQSAALRLSRSDNLSGETLQQVIADLDDAKALLQRMEQPDGQALGAQLDDVIDFWDGVCDVEIVMSREFDELVSRDAVAVQCTIEVIREAISNAVKHDRAHSATVELSLKDRQEIDVLVSHSDQTGSALLLSNSGLGSHIYDELTNSWELSKSQGAVVFRAKISCLTSN